MRTELPGRRRRAPSCRNLARQAIDLSIEERRVWVEIPVGFTEMQQQAPDRALEWRMQTREIFQTYFARGYRAVDFELRADGGGGRYLLARS